MTAAKSLQGQPKALHGTVNLDGFVGVGTASGTKPTARGLTGGDLFLIKPNQGKHNFFHKVTEQWCHCEPVRTLVWQTLNQGVVWKIRWISTALRASE